MHTRTYQVKAYRINAQTMRIRGRLTDTTPAGLYIDDDPDPLDVHDMVVDLVVGYPDLIIQSIDVVIDTHPHKNCASIEAAYQQLEGLSIGRGISRNLTERLGGPSGCSHVGALLKAMVPVAVQSLYSMQLADPETDKRASRQGHDPEALKPVQELVRNSCHVWADNSELVRATDAGLAVEAPVWISDRLEKLGRSNEIADWA